VFAVYRQLDAGPRRDADMTGPRLPDGFAVQVEAAAPTVARLTEAVFSALGSFHKTDLPPSA